MSELVQMVHELKLQVTLLLKQQEQLQIMIMKNKVDDTWLSEEVAAEMLGFQDRKYFRRRVKQNLIPIDYRSTNGKRFQYNRKSILKYKEGTKVEA